MLTLLALALATPPAPNLPRLVCDLGSSRWCVRESAQRTLERQGWPVSGVLRRVIATHPDPEVRARARVALECLLERELDRLGPYPMIDGLWWSAEKRQYDSDSAAYQAFDRYLSARITEENTTPYPYYTYRLASRDLARDLLLKGHTPWVIAALLHEGHWGDQGWLSGQGGIVRVPPGCPDGTRVWRGIPVDGGGRFVPGPNPPFTPPTPGGKAPQPMPPMVRPGPMAPARD